MSYVVHRMLILFYVLKMVDECYVYVVCQVNITCAWPCFCDIYVKICI